jgi:N-acetyl-gamma-glutamyl-phosphate reductase
MSSVYVIGGSGYTGSELMRILLNHPKVNELTVTARQWKDESVKEKLPHLDTELRFEELNLTKANRSDFVFVCLPHTQAMEIVPKLDTRVIDLSADFRIKDQNKYEAVYKVKHTAPNLLYDAVYGLPEIYRSNIKKARIVANPGCLATGAILALYPLVKNYDAKNIIVDAKTGISGAGKNVTETSHFPNLNENIVPYKLTNHRHIAEMEQELGVDVHFTPQVIPVTRGILTTVHAFVEGDLERVGEFYKKTYKREPFTKILADPPSILAVRGSNYCHIGGFAHEKGRVVLFSAIDNLVKGASGQAVQNMNIMAGWDERAGIEAMGLSP